MTFRNPVLTGLYPDPSVCRVGDDFYLVTSTADLFPGVPILHSRDLVHWRQIGHVLDRRSQMDLSDPALAGGVAAPTIRYHEGRFYVIATTEREGCFFVWSDDPAGSWSDPIPVHTPCIDPSLFFDEDGTVYFVSQSDGGAQGFTIDLETGALTSKRRVLWAGKEGKYPEAPHLYKVDGRYYLMIAEGGTELGHMESVARSDSPWGLWEPCPFNPILTHRDLPYSDPIQTAGHADLVQIADGSWWAVFLGIRPTPGAYPVVHHLGRETFLAPVTWTDGWPVIGDRGHVGMELPPPALPPHPWPVSPARDAFTTLGMEWVFRGNPAPDCWTVGDGLTLRATGRDLDERLGVAWIGRRQTHHDARVTTRVETDGVAGLGVLMNERHHYELVVSPGRIEVRRRIGDLQAVVAEAPLAPGPVQLTIAASATMYRMGFAQDGEVRWLAEGETRYLSTEVAGGYGGALFGLFALAGEARFAWFDYENGV